MEECEKRILELSPPNSKFRPIAIAIFIQEDGYRAGWRDALEYVYKQKTDPEATEIEDAILKELDGPE